MSELLLLIIIFFQFIFYFYKRAVYKLIGYKKLLLLMIFLGCLSPLPGWIVNEGYLEKNSVTVFLSITIWAITIFTFIVIEHRFRYKKLDL
ncbi:hypothetical protein ACGK9R_16900 [Halomonas sp. HNIBRBA4712]|uniref:hypothetical protein n=1 Tax=Halomonas sp. HNIBRBA4712 TaxID=3373087 RepID=UPI00374637C4